MTIDDIFKQGKPEEVIASLKQKQVTIPTWEDLEKEYNPVKHPIISDATLRPADKEKGGFTEKVAKLTYSAEKIAVRRMNQMAFTIPVGRKYEYESDNESLKEAADAIETVYRGVRINGVNINRMRAYFACCEICTIWYTTETQESHTEYGIDAKFKLRCRSYSPMNSTMSHISQASLYPLFDEYDDMIAMSIEYTRKEDEKDVTYFECYTSNTIRKWKTTEGKIEEQEQSTVTIGKIQCAYLNRPTPIFDGIANNRNEIEFALSRPSDIIRKNSAPKIILRGELKNEKDKPVTDIAKEIYHFKDSTGDLRTEAPALSTESTKFLVEQMRKNIEEEMQLPNLSMENIKGLGAISGEARKTLLTDAHMKVGEEKHSIIWFFERECNIIKALLSEVNVKWKDVLNQITVTHTIIPFVQNDEKAKTDTLSLQVASGIKSKRTAIDELGYTKDVNEELERIEQEQLASVGEPTN